MPATQGRVSVLCFAAVLILTLSVLAPTWAAGVFDQSTLQQTSQKVAPQYATLPGKRLCVCQDTSDPNSVGAVGYLNTSILNFGSYNLVTVICAFNPFSAMDGKPVATDFCRIFMEMK